MPAPALVLLAAGASRRYGTPKQLDPLGPHGETIMELTARDAVAAGVDRIVLVVNGENGSDVLDRMHGAVRRDGYADAVRIEAVEQRLDDLTADSEVPPGRTRPWGTAHALRTARPALADTASPIVIANADDWYGPDAITRIVQGANSSDDPGYGALVPYPLDVTLPPPSKRRMGGVSPDGVRGAGGVSRGIVEADAAGRLVDIREVLELRRAPGDPGRARGLTPGGSDVEIPIDTLCSMNLWALGPAIWDVLEDGFEAFLAAHGSERDAEWFLPDAVLGATAEGRLTVRMLGPGTVHLGITHPDDRERVREGLRTAVRAGSAPPTRLPSRPPGD